MANYIKLSCIIEGTHQPFTISIGKHKDVDKLMEMIFECKCQALTPGHDALSLFKVMVFIYSTLWLTFLMSSRSMWIPTILGSPCLSYISMKMMRVLTDCFRGKLLMKYGRSHHMIV